MKFSILVPVYNVEVYLKQCIESVLAQTYQNYELVLVDDGSTDGSALICDSYVETYPEKIRVIHKQNQGLISARRVGIQNATGDFCVFLDSDDFIESNLLESLNHCLIADGNIDILLYSFYYYRNGNREERKRKVAEDGLYWEGHSKKEVYEKLLFTVDITSIWTKAIRTSILKADETDYTHYYGKNMAEDLLQSLHPVTVAKKVKFIDQALYAYRINDESISRSFRPDTISKKNTLHVYEKILEYLPMWELDTDETRKRLEARWLHDTMYYFTKYYEAACNKNERQAVLEYAWTSMLPKNMNCLENQFVNPEYKKLYLLLEKKEFGSIHRCFLKKKCYKKLKEWKRKIIK